MKDSQYLRCPVEGCSYRTPATGLADQAAFGALVAHLKRKRHHLTHREALDLVARHRVQASAARMMEKHAASLKKLATPDEGAP